MKNLFYIGVFSLLLWSCQDKKQTTDSRNIDSKVNELLKSMTIEEKAGQMTQINLSVVMQQGAVIDSTSTIPVDPAKLQEAMHKYYVGSILNVSPDAYTQAQWYDLMRKVQSEALKTKNKIPVLYGIDAIHGATYTSNAILFPHNIAEAATRQPDFAYQACKITAKQVRASAVRWNFDPVLDVGRQPLWARFPETFGEDPYLVSKMGVSSIQGYEEDGLDKKTAVASCMKHFIGYSNPHTGRDRTVSYISDIQLREIYLPPFEAAVKAGSSTIMINSGEINGIPVHANKYLLTDVLRNELGFKGLIVTDWEDVKRLYERHKVADSHKEAVRMAVEAGIDMSMVPFDYSFATHIVELVKEGKLSEKRIDESVARILKLKFQLGLFDNPYGEEEAKAQLFDTAYATAALNSAREAITLLKNDSLKGLPILPLKGTEKILVTGPTANSLSSLNGCWSFTWQGDILKKYPSYYKTVADVFKEANPKTQILAEKEFADPKNYDIKALKNKAKSADVIVMCIGENAYAETPGTIFDLNLPKEQMDYVQAAIDTKKPVILVLLEGRPRIIRDLIPGVTAVVQAYWPGSMGAQAIYDVVSGKISPSGRLPYTYPMYANQLMTYDCKFSDVQFEQVPGEIKLNGLIAQWPFGHGLSYTTFEYSNLKISKNKIKSSDGLKVTVDVKNTGARASAHAVELYLSDLFASVTPSVKRLKGFSKINLQSGESKTVEFTLSEADYSFIGQDAKRIVEPGDFEITVGELKTKFTIE